MRFLWKAGVPAVLLLIAFLVSCGDTYRPIANPITQPPGDPQLFDAVYSMNQNISGLPGSMSEFNVSGDVVTGNRTASINPQFITFDASGSTAYVANRGSGNLSGNSPTSSAVVTISLLNGSIPVALGSSRVGTLLVADAGHSPDSTCPSTGTLDIINTANSVLTASPCVGPSPRFVLDTGSTYNKAFVLDASDNVGRFVDLNTNAVAGNQPTLGSTPVWAIISLDGTKIYVANRGSDNISVVDIATQTVVGTISTGGGPSFLILDKTLNRLYSANATGNSVSIFDASQATPSLLRTVPTGATPSSIAVLPDGSRAYVANSGEATLTEIKSSGFQTSTLNILDTTATPGATVTWVARSRDGSKVYASFVEPADLKNGTIVVRTSNDQVIATLAAPPRDIPACDQNPTTCPKERQRPVMLANR